MPRIDHHVHTSLHSPDSNITPSQLILDARAAGLDGVVITEHDYQWTPAELLGINRHSQGLLILSGVEVSALEGHFLVYGLPDLSEVHYGIELKDLLAIARNHGAAVVAAHPFRWDQDLLGILDQHGPAFDALELVSNNVTTKTRSLTQSALRDYPDLGATGSSDAHDPGVIGCYHSLFSRPIHSMSDFVAAIKSRAGVPAHRDGARLATGPVETPPKHRHRERLTASGFRP